VTIQWRKSSVSTAVNDEAGGEVAPVTEREAATLATPPTTTEH